MMLSMPRTHSSSVSVAKAIQALGSSNSSMGDVGIALISCLVQP